MHSFLQSSRSLLSRVSSVSLSSSSSSPPILSSTPSSRLISTTGSKRSWIFSSDKAKTSGHSKLLTDNSTVYEIVSDIVAPKDWETYLKHKAVLMTISKTTPAIKQRHIASWNFIHGDAVFKALHLVKYENGWTDVDLTRHAMKADPTYQKEYRAGLQLITQQSNEFLKSFSYWPDPDERKSANGNNIYDVRTYQVKPGSMYDWGNYWSRGIRCRTRVRADIPYAGLFTQLGKLHHIHHIWCYSDLDDRKNCREGTWHEPEWNEVVANTVPLIRTMSTRILEPLPFSPTQ